MSDLEVIKPSSTLAVSNNQDLLDLLGGLDTPSTPTVNMGLDVISENNNSTLPFAVNQNSNFLMGDLLNTNIVNGIFSKLFSVEDSLRLF